ncbi:hypothetical protein NIES3806_30350 [Microcystis aeruginosa NIES-3806]|nr:hypothetical protein NIES3806_30350 [Microcystis aeruginosa NIES-3806]
MSQRIAIIAPPPDKCILQYNLIIVGISFPNLGIHRGRLPRTN